MRKKLFSAVLAAAVTASAMPCITTFTVSAAEQTTNNSVSGYVSLNEGIKIAGTDKTPVIYVDNADYEGVIRAVGDLKNDIKAVTDVTPVVTNEIKTEGLVGAGGFYIGDDSMKISLPEPSEELIGADCYIAVYNRD